MSDTLTKPNKASSATGLNKRSRIVTEGDARSPNRAMMRAVGFTDEDFGKPIIGVANGPEQHHAVQRRIGRTL